MEQAKKAVMSVEVARVLKWQVENMNHDGIKYPPWNDMALVVTHMMEFDDKKVTPEEYSKMVKGEYMTLVPHYLECLKWLLDDGSEK